MGTEDRGLHDWWGDGDRECSGTRVCSEGMELASVILAPCLQDVEEVAEELCCSLGLKITS